MTVAQVMRSRGISSSYGSVVLKHPPWLALVCRASLLIAQDGAVLHKSALFPQETTDASSLNSLKPYNFIREGRRASPISLYFQGLYVPQVSAFFLISPTGTIHWVHFFFPLFSYFLDILVCSPRQLALLRIIAPVLELSG